jgi:AraC-like DNA-binding protein
MDPRIRIILRIMAEQKRTRQISSGEAGTLLGLSEAYFLRLFHLQAGATFGQCSLEVRMARAAELVKDPTLAIKRIALDAGYNDVSNFYRDFKQVHGMNPRQLRVRHLGVVMATRMTLDLSPDVSCS